MNSKSIGEVLVLAGFVLFAISLPLDASIAGLPAGLVCDVLGFALVAIAMLVFGTKSPLGKLSGGKT